MKTFSPGMLTVAAMVVALLVAVPSVATGGDGVDQPRADSVPVLDGQFEIPRPTGWTIVPPGDGAVAVFRSETDRLAQIEVRISDGITEGRWERYWRAFDTDLQEAGFGIVQPRQRQRHGGKQGFFYEYEFEREDDSFRLLVWHTHESERAWVFSAFFREERRNAYKQTFDELLGAMQW